MGKVGPHLAACFAFAALLVQPRAGEAADDPAPDNCIACHSMLPIERLSGPAKGFADDVHASVGFGCVDCHGGDASAADMSGMDPAKGFVGRPEGQQIPGFCGRCHSSAEVMKHYDPAARVDQVAQYLTSTHGRRLMEQGDTNVATCVSCHPVHTIRRRSDPRSSVHPEHVAETCGGCHADGEKMAAYAIPTDQLETYRQSIHWKTLSEGDLSAPTCNDCHGNHGAAPPGVQWVGNVCGQCHAMMAELYAQSAHAQIFTLIGQPGCETCHGNHGVREAGDDLLGLGEGAVCSQCHTADVGGGVAAAHMRSLIDSLKGDLEAAHQLLLGAENAGMEVSGALLDLDHGRTSLVSARAAVHSFDPAVVEKGVEEGRAIAAGARARGEQAMDELRFRRQGLAVSVVIIALLIAGLVLKIRQIERPSAAHRPAPRDEGEGDER